jgi:hypothetical protein
VIIGYAFEITGTGECRDADGNLLDSNGNPIEEKENDQ